MTGDRTDAQTARLTPLGIAVAMEALTGRKFAVVCVWCLHAIDPHEERPARAAGHGDCLRCPYSGPEIFVALEAG